jgi:AcrR family transcriptional regulator
MNQRGSYEPVRTRSGLVDAAFEEMMRSGYRGASLARIIASARVTKGALYHHFREGKRALGYAVLEERIRPAIEERWIRPLAGEGNPIDLLQGILRSVAERDAEELCARGSALGNLAQELSADDEAYRERLERVSADWRAAVAEALRRGQREGTVRENIRASDVATVTAAMAEGAASLAKLTRDPALLRTCVEGLGHYLEALRPRRAFRG